MPLSFNCLVADCPFSKLRAVNITVILDSCVSCLQTSNPMPLLAPVTNAILFLSLLLLLSCLFINGHHQSVYNIIMYYYNKMYFWICSLSSSLFTVEERQ